MGHGMSVVGSVLVALLFVCSLRSPAAAQASWYPSRYGPNDELGALNEITPQKILEAVRLVKDGKVYDLGQVYEDAAPAYPPRYWKSWILFHLAELARDRVYEFLFVFGAPRTRGTPQGIGRPIAMR